MMSLPLENKVNVDPYYHSFRSRIDVSDIIPLGNGIWFVEFCYRLDSCEVFLYNSRSDIKLFIGNEHDWTDDLSEIVVDYFERYMK